MPPSPRSEPEERWLPILDGDLAALARRTIEAVSTDPSACYASGDFTLARGPAGLALLHHSLAPSSGAARASQLLTAAMDAVENGNPDAGLYDGVAGVAYAMHEVWGSAHAAGQTEEVDTLLLDLLTGPRPCRGNFDLIGGICGIGVYGLKSLTSEIGQRLGHGAVAALDATAEQSDAGVTWRTPPHRIFRERERYPQGRYDLGVAHGAAGVVAFLSAACAAGLGGQQARRLLQGSVRWLLHEQLDGDAESSFPMVRGPDAAQPGEPARSAWCYGDPSAAVALLAAARVLADADVERTALQIARRSAARPPERTGVVDAGLCHGSAGLAHIYNRLFQATGEEPFADAARRWVAITLSMRTHPSAGAVLFPAWSPGLPGPGGTPSKGSWGSSCGFIEGSAGVALALLAALEPVRPTWDHALLLDIPAAAPLQARACRDS